MTQRAPKVSWTPEEDAHLTSLIKEHGTSWSIIETHFAHRDAKNWTDEEDSKLRQAVEDNRKAFSEVWKLVAEKIPDRTWQQSDFKIIDFKEI
ncbi:13662_t:CDS:2 [Racocetra fulgida]|uniref:13662_t:CDS:1 n=1 Tax=Racocetra fulgida TaxID=60492 RepID=A0A9N9FBJ3_9GLOM|nr:13662_t:CDS:2 [Racocetra fulgida]